MPKRKPEIVKILMKNKDLLSDFISKYEPKKEEEDFSRL